MYESFYGLKEKPFTIQPDPDFLFMSKVHKRALTYLNYGITENAGFILVTGEVGTGKHAVRRYQRAHPRGCGNLGSALLNEVVEMRCALRGRNPADLAGAETCRVTEGEGSG